MNVFKQLYTSIYSPRLISTFRFQGIGKTILFVFLLSLISTLPAAYFFMNGITNGLKDFDETLRNELPDFVITNSKLNADTNEPVEIRKGDFIVILDDTGTYGLEEIEAKHNAIGILKHQFVLATNGQGQAYEYNLLNIEISKQNLIELSQQFDQLLPIFLSVLGLFMYLFGSFIKFIEVTILALFGLLFKNSLKRKLNFKQIWILSVYSTTLATIFFFVMECLKVSVPSGFIINWFVHLMVLYLVLKEMPAPKNPLKTA